MSQDCMRTIRLFQRFQLSTVQFQTNCSDRIIEVMRFGCPTIGAVTPG